MRHKTNRWLMMGLVMILFLNIPVSAQQSVIEQGYYAADHTALTYDGTGWLTVSDGGNLYVQSSQAGDSVSFNIRGDQIILYRWLFADGGDMEICINAVCEIVSSNASETIHNAAIAYRLADSPAAVTITNVDAASGMIRLNAVQILTDSELHQVWPGEITKRFQVVNGEVFAIDQTITTGERVLLIPLTLIALFQFVNLVVTIWNQK